MLRLLWTIDRLRRRIERDPRNRVYSDRAIATSAANVELELYETSDSARRAGVRAKLRARSRALAAEG